MESPTTIGGEREEYQHSKADNSRRFKSPPRQPRNFRPTPSRSPTPSPLPTEPSPKYLAIASKTPSILPRAAHLHRKLLVLDLNGALLVRTARGTPYPRPFMPNFRDYLFHDETRKWLDVMVWSSAQPHNVEKMVRRCFFSSPDTDSSVQGVEHSDKWEGKLIAVWARDTMGLSDQAYFRKTQTTKDLAKPWSQLSGSPHSAQTTILLDDSPLKARLQPYNHLCISEYNGKARERDLQSKSSINEELELLRASSSTSDEKSQSGGDMSLSNGDSKEGDIDSEPAMTDRERRRKEKKQRKKLEKAVAKQAKHSHGIFDETLLAVIGILDEVKQQENVAAWIRHGGLWAGNSPPPERTYVRNSGSDEGNLDRPVSPTDAEVEDEEAHPLPPPSSQPTVTSSSPPSSPPSSPSTKSESTTRISKRLRSVTNEDRSEGAKKGRSTLDGNEEAVLASGNDAESLMETSESKTEVETPSRAQMEDAHPTSELKKDMAFTSTPEEHNLWFEHPNTLRYWVTRGRFALREFKILEDDGVEGDPAHFAETYKH